jgi:integrase/recombinase XerD
MTADEDIRNLLSSILGYLVGFTPAVTRKETLQREHLSHVLTEFLLFAIHKGVDWKDMFTLETFTAFRKHTGITGAGPIISLSQYLHEKGSIDQPLIMPNYHIPLPDIYEQYLLYIEQTKTVRKNYIFTSRRVMVSLHIYLETHRVDLPNIKVEDLDAFLSEFIQPFADATRRDYLSHLRGFLKYLYCERKVLDKDLAPMLAGPRVFTQSNPPRFLRDEEIQRLFNSIDPATPSGIRTYAMAHLVCSLGLRPIEISKITLDDVSFKKAQLTLPQRKTNKPVILPVPENTLKAIAAYVLNVRPKAIHRELFLTFNAPCRPVGSNHVTLYISAAMKKAGLSASPYALRHSYARNLLLAGRSIYEIKEMMGHENIESTRRYLYIDTELMRKVILNETI